MTDLDQLPPEQRAVLSLILRQGKGYDDVAALLRVRREDVQARALAGLTALGPPELSELAPEIRQEVGDYVLGQQTPAESEATRALFRSSAGACTWGRGVSEKLADLASSPLPSIPAGRFTGSPAPPRAPAEPPAAQAPKPPGPALAAGGPARPSGAAAVPPRPGATPAGNGPTATRRPAAPSRAGTEASARRQPPLAAPPPAPPTDEGREEREERSSRLGGYLVLGALAVVLAAVIIIVLNGGFGGGSSGSDNGAVSASTRTRVTSTQTSTALPRIEAQINFTPTPSFSHALAVANIIAQGTLKAFALSAQGLAPTNGFAYAVWLYNSQSDAKLLGFIDQQVTANGQAKAIGSLPANASHYREMIITRETAPRPTQPGTIVLTGQLGSAL